LIVDDNSPDATGAKVKELQPEYPERLYLLEREGKQGLGTAYIAGFKWALERSYMYVFEMDADFSHNPNDLIRLYNACSKGSSQIAIGSRYVTGVNVVNWPMGRVLLSWLASKYVKFITGMDIHDTTAKFVGYAFQIEMKFKAYLLKFKIKEIPVVFTDRTKGNSKMSKGIISEAVFGVIKMKIKSLFKRYEL